MASKVYVSSDGTQSQCVSDESLLPEGVDWELSDKSWEEVKSEAMAAYDAETTAQVQAGLAANAAEEAALQPVKQSCADKLAKKCGLTNDELAVLGLPSSTETEEDAHIPDQSKKARVVALLDKGNPSTAQANELAGYLGFV